MCFYHCERFFGVKIIIILRENVVCATFQVLFDRFWIENNRSCKNEKQKPEEK